MTHQEILALRDAIARSLASKTHAVVATLASREGHSYREVGDMMVATEALERVGGVSGGCLEAYIARVGREILRNSSRGSAVMSFDTISEEPDKPTLGCGGRLEVLIESAGPVHLDFLDRLLQNMQHGTEAVVLLRFGPRGTWPDAAGCRQIVHRGGATWGGPVDSVDLNLTEQARSLRESLTATRDDHRVSATYVWPRPRLAIFGAGDDAQPLCQIAHLASWHVTVADRRARLATPRRFPQADAIRRGSWRDAVAHITRPAQTAVVVMTHSFDDDLELMPPLVQLRPMYLGLLGPSSRTDRLWDLLGNEARDRVYAPVGLPLGDKAPSAIAVAIMAQLIAVRRGRVIEVPTTAGAGP